MRRRFPGLACRSDSVPNHGCMTMSSSFGSKATSNPRETAGPHDVREIEQQQRPGTVAQTPMPTDPIPKPTS